MNKRKGANTMLTLHSFFPIFHHCFSWLLVFLSRTAKGQRKQKKDKRKGSIISKAKRMLFENGSPNKEEP